MIMKPIYQTQQLRFFHSAQCEPSLNTMYLLGGQAKLLKWNATLMLFFVFFLGFIEMKKVRLTLKVYSHALFVCFLPTVQLPRSFIM